MDFVENILNFNQVFLHWAFIISLLAVDYQKRLLGQMDHDLEWLREGDYAVSSLATLFKEQLCQCFSRFFR